MITLNTVGVLGGGCPWPPGAKIFSMAEQNCKYYGHPLDLKQMPPLTKTRKIENGK